MTQPKTKADELIERINALVKQEHRDQLAVRRLKQEADQLAKTHAYEAYMARGIVACLEGNLEESRSYHEKSLHLSDDALGYQQYACSLCNFGLNLEALPYFERAYRQVRNDTKLIDDMIRASFYGLQFRYAASLLADWRKLTNTPSQYESVLLECVEYVEQHDIQDDETRPLADLISSLWAQNTLRLMSQEISVTNDGNTQWVEHRTFLSAEIDTVMDLNLRFIDLAIEQISEKIMNAFVVKFEPNKNNADKAA